MDVSTEKCLICAEQTGDDCRSVMQLVTKYSGTLVFKVLERFLDSDLSENVPTLIAAVVCPECVVKLNDYDAAYTKALIIQKEFTDLLKKNLVLPERKKDVEDEMYFKEEPDTASSDYLVECDRTSDEILEEKLPKPASTSVEEKVSMKCNLCKQSFKSMHEMQAHTHGPRQQEEVEFHVEFVDETDSFSLGEEYIEEERLSENRYEETPLENTEEEVQNEDIWTPVQEMLPQDKRKHVKTASNKCSICNIDFGSKKKLKTHIKEEHPEIENSGDSHECDICGLKVKTKSNLLSHITKHEKDKRFACSYCGRYFQSKGTLTRHLPMHTGEKPYQCDKCGKQFCHQSSFTMHKLMHDDIREKKCEICGFALRNSSHLKRHMRIHSGERPFECPACGQKFAQRYNMTAHLRAHQGIYREQSRIYKCPFCDQMFQRKLKLQEHLTRQHNTVVDSALLKPSERNQLKTEVSEGDKSTDIK
ncbi:zinc finger protein 260-like [Wyeomyia smithii]|uniref:zinc finger protein 260-like n=1 Tax=Wyeomyia smithii TaxID=174621 RepID=UPI002467E1F8|nr:zinc finger protein 260-like [Wyeomyia smithii]